MTESVQTIKQRFGIIGDNPRLNRALEKAIQVAPTDISVLVTGESGVGKESIPKIIHHLSHRKHGKYIAVNCGAIPEGTIDSELFGHEKGAFTGAASARAGYFEVADGGTIFLDEVGELPLTTQVRLLRVLENGEFIRVGSSEVKKTNVRIVAATNMNMQEAVQNEKFREDLYYRLSTVEIHLPPLRDRKGDIHLLFRKFAADFAQKYKMPVIRLEETAVGLLENYHWGGNIRQLRNVAEQISILETQRNIGPDRLREYLPVNNRLPALAENKSESGFSSEREILYKVLFDMKSDLNDLKKLTLKLIESGDANEVKEENRQLISKIYGNPDLLEEDDADVVESLEPMKLIPLSNTSSAHNDPYDFAEEIEEEETLSLQEKEQELIRKALERNNGKRKLAAKELGISERTLYRKIKQLDL